MNANCFCARLASVARIERQRNSGLKYGRANPCFPQIARLFDPGYEAPKGVGNMFGEHAMKRVAIFGMRAAGMKRTTTQARSGAARFVVNLVAAHGHAEAEKRSLRYVTSRSSTHPPSTTTW